MKPLAESVSFLEPQALDKAAVCRFLGIGPKILQRMISATRRGDTWLVFASNHTGKPKQRLTVTTASARAAFDRLCRGDEPPLLPCEQSRKEAA